MAANTKKLEKKLACLVKQKRIIRMTFEIK